VAPDLGEVGGVEVRSGREASRRQTTSAHIAVRRAGRGHRRIRGPARRAGRAALAAAGELQHSVLSPSFSPPDPVGRLVVVDTPLGSSSWEWTGLDRARGSGGAAEALRWVEACALGRDD
jgi:hypothetical protein